MNGVTELLKTQNTTLETFELHKNEKIDQKMMEELNKLLQENKNSPTKAKERINLFKQTIKNEKKKIEQINFTEKKKQREIEIEKLLERDHNLFELINNEEKSLGLRESNFCFAHDKGCNMGFGEIQQISFHELDCNIIKIKKNIIQKKIK